MDVSKTHDHIHIQIKIPKPSQEPPVYSKILNRDIQDMDVLCAIKIKIKSLNKRSSAMIGSRRLWLNSIKLIFDPDGIFINKEVKK